jgi:hypothetical protein
MSSVVKPEFRLPVSYMQGIYQFHFQTLDTIFWRSTAIIKILEKEIVLR